MGQVAFGNKSAARCAAINLAHASCFSLGLLEILPATRQVRRGGRSETLEPRVMQVLVALGGANGAVVSRDDLIASCWDGRIVGDNAIQRTISRLRDVAAGIGSGCFQLETVNKVGYRLIELGPALQAGEEKLPVPPVTERNAGRQRGVLTGLASALGLAAIGAALTVWAPAPASGPIIIAVAGRDHDSADIASGLAIDLARLANAGGAIVFADTTENPRSDYVLVVTERRIGHGVQADLGLARKGSQSLLWSASFTGGPHDAALLRQRASLAVFKVAGCALDTNSDQAQTNAASGQVFSACERLDGVADELTVAQWRRIVALSPNNGRALATLAFSEAVFSTVISGQKEGAELRAAARTHLEKARALNGQLGLTYAAEVTLTPPWQYRETQAQLERGLAKDPDCAALHALKSDALQAAGFMDGGLAAARKAVELEPGYASYRGSVALALAYNGFTGAANAELTAAELLWPDSVALQAARIRYDFRFGNAPKLLRQIDSGRALPDSPSVVAYGPMRAFVLARAKPSPANVEAAAELAIRYSSPPQVALQSLAALGRIDQAYALLERPNRLAGLRDAGTYILFRSNARPLLLDRRFMRLADRLGLVQFWLSSDMWPDFCGDKDLPYNCKTEAQRLRANKAA
ncbi:MAG TPA: winged helix-turn-helix domain-containing protein [Rhizomicrobium sp.]|nr:winged helix-turn-helix domain-containing protein [Rhizomicrobium sp.]